MRGEGFEPSKALSHRILSPAHLAALAPPLSEFTRLTLTHINEWAREP